jgi:hypothetical protein
MSNDQQYEHAAVGILRELRHRVTRNDGDLCGVDKAAVWATEGKCWGSVNNDSPPSPTIESREDPLTHISNLELVGGVRVLVDRLGSRPRLRLAGAALCDAIRDTNERTARYASIDRLVVPKLAEGGAWMCDNQRIRRCRDVPYTANKALIMCENRERALEIAAYLRRRAKRYHVMAVHDDVCIGAPRNSVL